MPAEFAVPRAPRRPEDDAVFKALRRARRLREEVAVRGAVALLILAFNEVFGLGSAAGADPVIRVAALAGLLVNGPYYLAARTGRAPRLQAYIRMLVDIAFITVGVYGAGGLAAAPYLGVYALVPVYAGIVFSSLACLVATWAATAAYLAVALLQEGRWLPVTASPMPNAWAVAAFNLLVLNLVGGLTALLAEAYRRSQLRLGSLYQNLERAHDEALKLNIEIQRAAQFQVLGEVAAGVTHEIRNLLQAVFGHLALARQKGGRLAPEMAPHLDHIQRSCEAATRILNTALETARQPVAEQGPVAVPEVARRLVELKGYDLRRDRIVIRLDFPPDFPPVLAVSFQLQQVLLNLVTNAQDALRGSPQPRAIAIVGRAGSERVVIEVSDTGPGLKPDVLPRVFEPFFTTKPDGTGLGLAISAGIVRDLGGELTAGNGPDGGAVFRISLPALPPEGAKSA